MFFFWWAFRRQKKNVALPPTFPTPTHTRMLPPPTHVLPPYSTFNDAQLLVFIGLLLPLLYFKPTL